MIETAQAPGRGPAPVPICVVYNTSMSRPDAPLALGAMYAFANKREARIGSVCVAGAGLRTAIFCDIVGRFFRPGAPGNSNSNFAVGLAAVTPLPPDPPMVAAALDRKKENGEPQYVRTIAKLSDTAQAEAVIRNGVILSTDSALVLSAPATWLAKSMDTLGTKDQFRERVKRFVIVDGGAPQADPASLRRVIAGWPGPLFFCGRDVGEALTLPGASVEKAFAWARMHPVVDAYRAFKPMPYDIPAHDLAAMHYTVHPDSGFFTLSEPGTLAVSDAGAVSFAPGGGGGNVRRLIVDQTRKAEAIAALLEIASAEPPAPPAPRGRGAA